MAAIHGCGWISLPDHSKSRLTPHAILCPAGNAARVKIGGILRGGQSACGEFCRPNTLRGQEASGGSARVFIFLLAL